jgi:hypothetical protein
MVARHLVPQRRCLRLRGSLVLVKGALKDFNYPHALFRFSSYCIGLAAQL